MKKIVFKLSALLLGLFTIVSCDGQPVYGDSTSANGGPNMFDKMFGSWQSLVIQMTATIIMIFLVSFFLMKPVRKILQARKDYVVEQISAADQIKANAELKEKEADERLASIDDEAKAIIDQAKKNADEIKENANKEIEQEKLEQKELLAKQLEQEKEKAKEEIRKEIVNVALVATSSILEREVNEDDNQKIIENFIKEVGTDE